ncbi:UNVERIFIED_CONTAM: hypothetical protein GTU68_007918 [Idotea baltica]|nr:hypothetical protein [Idotea baltica]
MGLDVNEVAAWNEITDTTKLQVGKRIRLTKPIGFVATPEPVPNESDDRRVVSVSPERPAAKNIPSATPNVSSPSNRSEVSESKPSLVKSLTDWGWPLKGKVVRGFSQAQGHQGIDILGELGQAVLSTNTGEVVYVGNGLKGYGNLVIIKHNEAFLSAYAHNSEIYVREGEQVSTQQRIASVGVNRNRQTALHFQIRKNGQPVNPVSYLSK